MAAEINVPSTRSSINLGASDLYLSAHKLLGEDCNDDLPSEKLLFRTKGQFNRWRNICIATIFFAIGLTAYTTIPKFYHAAPTGREFGDCGSNPDEARKHGCVFDHISFVWVQPQCYYPDLLADYANQTALMYYSDSSMMEETRISLPEIMTGDYSQAWGLRKFHSVHCAFTVLKMHWALVHHLPLDSAAVAWEHTDHCQLVLLDELPGCDGGRCEKSRLSAKYTSCGYT